MSAEERVLLCPLCAKNEITGLQSWCEECRRTGNPNVPASKNRLRRTHCSNPECRTPILVRTSRNNVLCTDCRAKRIRSSTRKLEAKYEKACKMCGNTFLSTSPFPQGGTKFCTECRKRIKGRAPRKRKPKKCAVPGCTNIAVYARYKHYLKFCAEHRVTTEPHFPAHAHRRRFLTDDEVRAIRRTWTYGLSNYLAREYGLSTDAVVRIVRRDTYKNVPDEPG